MFVQLWSCMNWKFYVVANEKYLTYCYNQTGKTFFSRVAQKITEFILLLITWWIYFFFFVLVLFSTFVSVTTIALTRFHAFKWPTYFKNRFLLQNVKDTQHCRAQDTKGELQNLTTIRTTKQLSSSYVDTMFPQSKHNLIVYLDVLQMFSV
jgi:hypothetical protein